MTDAVIHALDKARERVAELLQTPDSLQKVSAMKVDLLKKRLLIETQLKAVVQKQLEDTRLALQHMEDAEKMLQGIRDDAKTIDAACLECQTLIYRYPLVKEINTTRRNIVRVLQLRDQINSIPSKVAELRELLDNDENLLEVHGELRKLEYNRSKCLDQADNSPHELGALEEYFGDVDELTSDVEKRLWSLLGRTFDLAASQPALLIQVLRIIEREEVANRKIQGRVVPKQEAFGTLKCGYYAKTMENVLDQMIENRFMGHTSTAETIPDLIAALEFVQEDLTLVIDNLQDIFPPKYNILDFFGQQYHLKIYLELQKLIGQHTPQAGEILALVNWIKEYQGSMAALGLADLKPVYMDQFSSLLSIYVDYVKDMMRNWIGEIVKQDGMTDPEVDDLDGLLSTPTPVELFKIVTQQTELAMATSRGKFLYDIAQECIDALRYHQQLMFSEVSNVALVVSSGQNKLKNPDTDAAEKDYLGYLIAQINNCSKCLNYLDEFYNKVNEAMDLPYSADFKIEEVQAGLYHLSKHATNTVRFLIFQDINPLFERFFSNEWFTEEMAANVGATFDQIFEMAQPVMVEGFYLKLVMACMEHAVEGYLTPIVTKKFTFKGPLIEKIKSDVLEFQKFWAKHITKEERIDKAWEVMWVVISLLEGSPALFKDHFESLLGLHPDATVSAVEHIMASRADFKKGDVKAAVKVFKELKEQQELHSDDEEGLFTRIERTRSKRG